MDIPWEVLMRVRTLAQSVMSDAVVAILATSAPDAHIDCRVVSRALSLGVFSKLCEDRMTLVLMGTAPPPVTLSIGVGLQCRVRLPAGCFNISLQAAQEEKLVVMWWEQFVEPCSAYCETALQRYERMQNREMFMYP